MKAAKGQFPAALDRPDPAVRFYLFHGPDEAGSRALAIRLLKGLGDAEKFVVLGNSVKTDPASLADEAGAMALFGGPRAIWIEPAGDEIVAGVQALLDAPASESAVVALAGTLRKTSALLKLAESHPAALGHCSYVPEGRDMVRLIVESGRGYGLQIAPNVAERLAAASDNNQAVVAQELNKMALFLGASPAQSRELDNETIDAIGADHAESDWMRLGDLALSGRSDELLAELERLPQSGADVIPSLRALQRRLLMLAPLRKGRGGRTSRCRLKSMGKALFWKDKPMMQQLLSNWSAQRLQRAADRVAELERQVMRSQVDGEATLGELMVSFARVARRAGR